MPLQTICGRSRWYNLEYDLCQDQNKVEIESCWSGQKICLSYLNNDKLFKGGKYCNFLNAFLLNTKLNNAFNKLEAVTNKVLHDLSVLDDVKLNYKPTKGKWSINEILTHLLASEIVSINYMKKKSLGIDRLEDSGIIEWFKLYLLKLSQRVPFKYKAPKYLVETTPTGIPLREITMQWKNAHAEMKAFFESIENKNIRKKIYKHPVAGYLDVIQATCFMREHVRHHMPQIERLQKQNE